MDHTAGLHFGHNLCETEMLKSATANDLSKTDLVAVRSLLCFVPLAVATAYLLCTAHSLPHCLPGTHAFFLSPRSLLFLLCALICFPSHSLSLFWLGFDWQTRMEIGRLRVLIRKLNRVEAMHDIFKTIDVDGSTTITEEEMAEFIGHHSPKKTTRKHHSRPSIPLKRRRILRMESHKCILQAQTVSWHPPTYPCNSGGPYMYYSCCVASCLCCRRQLTLFLSSL